MKEIPIIFSTPMVQAILAGNKTMTRRVVKPQPDSIYECLGVCTSSTDKKDIGCIGFGIDCRVKQFIKRPWQKGDKLWVRETTWISECKRYIAQGLERGHSSELDIVDLETGKRYIHQRDRGDYAIADGMITSWSWRGRYLRSNRQTEDFDVGFADVDTAVKIIPFSGNIILQKYDAQFRKKLPSIHMPKVATRLWLEVVNVRVERLQDITEEDARAEGYPFSYTTGFPIADFMFLWNSIYSKRGHGWNKNPWVWVIEFKRLEDE